VLRTGWRGDTSLVGDASCKETAAQNSRSQFDAHRAISFLRSARKRKLARSTCPRVSKVTSLCPASLTTISSGAPRSQTRNVRSVLELFRVSMEACTATTKPYIPGDLTTSRTSQAPDTRIKVGVDAGNISFGITCPYGAAFCQFAAGFAQTLSGNPNFN
jgi:hypothetical protein